MNKEQSSVDIILIILLSAIGLFVLQPHIGINDCDAYGYITGAYSLQDGNGYRNLLGEGLSWWPIGYSAILSVFSNPIIASQVINYLSFGLFIALFYMLLMQRQWPRVIALCLSVAIGFGFMRILACRAKPDVLNYTGFLLALYLHEIDSENSAPLLGSYVIWSVLIALKYISFIFVPAALIIDWLPGGKLRQKRDFLKTGLIITFWGLINILLAGYAINNSGHIPHIGYVKYLDIKFYASNILLYPKDALLFIKSLGRSFLTAWYGSIKTYDLILLFAISLSVALWCLGSLRIKPRFAANRSLHFAIIIFTFTLIIRLLLGRQGTSGDTDVRLTGYGVIVLFLGLYPIRSSATRWIIYASLIVCIATVNQFSVNSLGMNDPRYRELVYDLKNYVTPGTPIYTNSYHILDIHGKIPSVPITKDIDTLPKGSRFLWVGLPRYDGITRPVWPMKMPGVGWKKVLVINNAILFQKD